MKREKTEAERSSCYRAKGQLPVGHNLTQPTRLAYPVNQVGRKSQNNALPVKSNHKVIFFFKKRQDNNKRGKKNNNKSPWKAQTK